MSAPTDSPEVQKMMRILRGLAGVPEARPARGGSPPPAVPVPRPPAALPPSSPPPAAALEAAPRFREAQLERVLGGMCERGGFQWAVIADASGLPLAGYESPLGGERVAVAASVLGDALARVAGLLGQGRASSISLDVDDSDKVVVRQFRVGAAAFNLLVLCPRDVDQRSHLEVALSQVTTVLTGSSGRGA